MAPRNETAPVTGATMGSEALTMSSVVQEAQDLVRQAPEVTEKKINPMMLVAEKWKETVRTHDRIVLTAPPGAGKSTDAIKLIYEALGSDTRIIVTQPTRLAARGLAESAYVRSLFGKNLVAQKLKGEDKTTEQTRVTYTVNQSLLNVLQRDPMLSEYRVGVIDEGHLLTGAIEVELPLLKKAQELRRAAGIPQIKFIVASGSLNKEQYLEYLPGAVSFDVEGKNFPVVPHFAESPIEEADMPDAAVKKAAEIIAAKRAKGEKIGKILMFFKGKGPIEETMKLLKNNPETRGLRHIKLMGGEEASPDQDKIYDEEEDQIVVSSNVAEQAITVPGVKVVIGSGYMNMMVRDEETGLMTLQTVEITKSNMTQQAGRAGRLEGGEVFWLFTRAHADARPEFLKPEMLRTDLTEIVLKLKSMGVKDIASFDFMNKPTAESIASAIDKLQKLGALDAHGTITGVGEQMEELPLDPHFARMLIEAKKRGCLEAVSVLIGFLSTKRRVFAYNPQREQFDRKYPTYVDNDSDFISLLKVWNDYVENVVVKKQNRYAWASGRGLRGDVLYDVETAREEIVGDDFFKGSGFKEEPGLIDLIAQKDAIQQCIVAGFMDSLLEGSGDGTYALANGRLNGIVLDPSSALKQHPTSQIVSAGVRVMRGGETHASLNQKVTNELIAEVAPYIKEIHAEQKKEQEELKREQKEAVIEAQRTTDEHAREEPISAALAVPEEFKKKVSFMQKAKQSIATFFARIRKFFGGK